MKYNYKNNKKFLGGALTAVGTAVGGPVGGAIGGGVGTLLERQLNKPKKQQELVQPIYARGNMGYKYGGKMKKKLPKYPMGGQMPMGQDASKYIGPSHEQGGIPVGEDGNVDPNNPIAEVEGGETRQGDYIFSDELIVPGTEMTFAEAHEMLIAEGAGEQEIQQLEQMQEQVRMEQGVEDPMMQQEDPMMQEQEMATMGEEQMPMMKKGGNVPQYYKYGGSVKKKALGGSLLEGAQRYAPSAIDAGLALFTPRQKDFKPKEVRPETIKADRSNFNTGRRDIGTSSRTAIAGGANPNAVHAQTLKGVSDLTAGQNQLETNVANQNAQNRQAVSAQNVQMQNQAQQANLENRSRDTASRMNLLRNAVSIMAIDRSALFIVPIM